MFKVHKPICQDKHKWIATFKYPENAAILITSCGNGSRICTKPKTLWQEGAEQQPAPESHDYVAKPCYERANNP